MTIKQKGKEVWVCGLRVVEGKTWWRGRGRHGGEETWRKTKVKEQGKTQAREWGDLLSLEAVCIAL
jgi:hypothetical protein